MKEVLRRIFARLSNPPINVNFPPKFEPFGFVLGQICLHGKVCFWQIQRVFQLRGHARWLSTPRDVKAGNFIIGDGFKPEVDPRQVPRASRAYLKGLRLDEAQKRFVPMRIRTESCLSFGRQPKLFAFFFV